MNIAIVPMKTTSSRVKNKNFRDLAGKPLWRWTVDKLLESQIFDKIFLSTDNLNLISDFENDIVTKIERPKSLCKSEVHTIEVVFSVLRNQKSISNQDNIYLLLPTSPFRSIDTLKKANQLLNQDINSVIAITQASKGSNSYRTINNDSFIINLPKDSSLHLQSTDANEYLVTGSLFASKYEHLILNKSFHQTGGYGLIVSEFEAIDINTELDFLTATVYAKENL